MSLERTGPSGKMSREQVLDWAGIADQLKRDGRIDEALEVILKCIDSTVHADGDTPTPRHFERAAIIFRKRKEYDREIEILRRYLTVASKGTSARPRMETRLRRAWKLQHGNENAPVPQGPPPPDPQKVQALVSRALPNKDGTFTNAAHNALMSAYDRSSTFYTAFQSAYDAACRNQEREIQQAFDARPVLDLQAEQDRRQREGLPHWPLDRALWTSQALDQIHWIPEGPKVVEAIDKAADHWGVIVPDHDRIDARFEPDPYSRIDTLTGEEIRNEEPVTLWLATEANLPYDLANVITKKLTQGNYELLEYWVVPGSYMYKRILLEPVDEDD